MSNRECIWMLSITLTNAFQITYFVLNKFHKMVENEKCEKPLNQMQVCANDIVVPMMF